MIKEIGEEDVVFIYEEGNDNYAELYELDLVSATDNYVYFEVTGTIWLSASIKHIEYKTVIITDSQ